MGRFPVEKVYGMYALVAEHIIIYAYFDNESVNVFKKTEIAIFALTKQILRYLLFVYNKGPLNVLYINL